MGFENKIEFKEGIVNVFEIYNQKLFSEIINPNFWSISTDFKIVAIFFS